ncbi:MAG: response regulator [Deltaproteobacteria bacterium]|nr:response regulator [Deltaproteobacteria bacterium]
MPTVLIVDDEAHIREVVQYALEREGFTVRCAADGHEALRQAESGGVDLVVLDILMPELDGLEVCRRLRARGPIPIIFLSSRGEEVDRIVGLELGGDDYVAKPFSPRELATRVKAVLRRAAVGAASVVPQATVATAAVTPAKAEVLRHGRVEVDLPCFEVRVDGRKVDLTVTEFRVLHALLERPGRVLTRSQLIDRARSDDYHITERTIDTHIRRIRAKLRPFGVDPITTVHGLGYKASDPE